MCQKLQEIITDSSIDIIDNNYFSHCLALDLQKSSNFKNFVFSVQAANYFTFFKELRNSQIIYCKYYQFVLQYTFLFFLQKQKCLRDFHLLQLQRMFVFSCLNCLQYVAKSLCPNYVVQSFSSMAYRSNSLGRHL